MKTFGTQIKFYRGIAKLTQNELAKKANCTDAYICLLEQDKRIPSDKFCVKLAEALQCDLKKILVDKYCDDVNIHGIIKTLLGCEKTENLND